MPGYPPQTTSRTPALADLDPGQGRPPARTHIGQGDDHPDAEDESRQTQVVRPHHAKEDRGRQPGAEDGRADGDDAFQRFAAVGIQNRSQVPARQRMLCCYVVNRIGLPPSRPPSPNATLSSRRGSMSYASRTPLRPRRSAGSAPGPLENAKGQGPAQLVPTDPRRMSGASARGRCTSAGCRRCHPRP